MTSLRTSTTRIHAYGDDALGTDDATGVAARIRRREVSVDEVIDAAVARVDRVNPHLNAVVVRDLELARRRARGLPTGPFGGVPTFVKDNTDVRGLPTNQGTRAFRAGAATSDGAFAAQLLAQGLVCLGKSTMPEFGLNASTEPAGREPTRNPWHLAYSPGASSGGAAALVASGAVPLAHANDGGGSIRIPAAACGLVGLKPSRGRLRQEKGDGAPIDIVCHGIVSRSMRDTARFLHAADLYHRTTALPAVGDVRGPGATRLRIGVVTTSPTGYATDAETTAAVVDTADALSALGHDVGPVDLPVDARFMDDFVLYWGMLAALLGRLGPRIMHPDFDASRVDDLTKGLSRHFGAVMWRTPAALRRLHAAGRAYSGAFAGVDVVLSPTLSHTTPALGHLSPEQPYEDLIDRLTRYVGFTPVHNVVGAPALSVPGGRTSTGLPIGVMLSAPVGHEARLLEVGYELEAAAPWPRLDQV